MATLSNISSERRQQWLILWLVFIGCLGSALAYPIFPPLFLHPSHGEMLPLTMSLHQRSLLLGVTLAAFPFGVFLGAPLLGVLADRFGKGKMIVLSLTLASFGYGISGIAIAHHQLLLLIVSRFLTGMVEGVIAIARSMAADLTRIDRRQTLGRVNAVACLSYIVGPLLGGLLANHALLSVFTFSFPFYCAAITSLITAIITAPFILKLAPKSNSNNAPSFITSLNLLAQLKRYAKIPGLQQVLWASTLFTLGVDMYYEFFPVLLTLKWHFHPWQIALFLSSSFIFLSLGSTVLVTILRTKIGKDKLTTLILVAISSITVILCSHFTSQWLTLADIILLNLALAGATTQLTSTLSHTATDNMQGSVMGMQLGLRMLGDALLCLVGSSLIVLSLSLPFVIAAITMLCASAVLIRIFYKYASSNKCIS